MENTPLILDNVFKKFNYTYECIFILTIHFLFIFFYSVNKLNFKCSILKKKTKTKTKIMIITY